MQFEFCDNERCVGFRILTDALMLPEVDRIALFYRVPGTVVALKEYCAKNKIEVAEVLPDISFTAFWNKYDYKDGGSKKMAEKLWTKLSDGERTKAMNYIVRYKQHCANKMVAQAYATTYLNQCYYER